MHSLQQRGLIGNDSRYPEIEAVGGLFMVAADTDPDEVRWVVESGEVRALELAAEVRDFGFLEGLPLEFLFVIAPQPDISPVNTLERLRSLALNAWTGQLELERLPALEWFAVTEIERGQLEQLIRPGHHRLSHLSIGKYREADLRGLAALPAIMHLDLGYSRSLRSLAGLEELRELRLLDLWSCRALTALDGVQLAAGLEFVRLEACHGITDLESVASLPRLRGIQLDLRMPPPLLPLAGHPRLEFVWVIGGKRPPEEYQALLDNPALIVLQANRGVWMRTSAGWQHVADIYAMSEEQQARYEELHTRRSELGAW